MRSMSKLRKVLSLVIISILLLALVSCASNSKGTSTKEASPAETSKGASVTPPKEEKKERIISIGTGATGALFYILGAKAAEIWTANMPGIKVTAEQTAGGIENTRLVDSGKMDIGMVHPGQAWEYYNGIGGADKKYDNTRSLVGIHTLAELVIVRQDSKIRTWEDLKGQRLGFGTQASILGEMAQRVFLESLGITAKQYTANYLGFVEQAQALQNKQQVSALLPYPSGALDQLLATTPIRVLPITQAQIDYVAKNGPPGWTPVTIPAGTIKGMDKDFQTFGITQQIIVNKNLDDQLTYDLVKVILANNKELAKVHPKGAEWDLEHAALAIKIPFHPGAKKYLVEKGLANLP